jgi:hypothetical protein
VYGTSSPFIVTDDSVVTVVSGISIRSWADTDTWNESPTISHAKIPVIATFVDGVIVMVWVVYLKISF